MTSRITFSLGIPADSDDDEWNFISFSTKFIFSDFSHSLNFLGLLFRDI